MKIKKYIAAIVLAMSLTTGLVFANATNSASTKQNLLSYVDSSLSDVDGLNNKIGVDFFGYYFDDVKMSKNPRKDYKENSKEKPFPFKNLTGPEHSMFLAMFLDNMTKKFKLREKEMKNMYEGFRPQDDEKFCSGIISYDYNLSDATSEENAKKFYEAMKKADFKEIEDVAITKKNFVNVKKKVIDMIKTEKATLKSRYHRNEKALKFLTDGDKDGAVKFLTESLKKDFGKIRGYSEKTDFNKLAKKFVKDDKLLKKGMQIFDIEIKFLENKLKKVKDLQFSKVEALKGKFHIVKD